MTHSSATPRPSTEPQGHPSTPSRPANDATTPSRATFNAAMAGQKPLPSSPFPQSLQLPDQTAKPKAPRRDNSQHSRKSADSADVDMDDSDWETNEVEEGANLDEDSLNTDASRSNKKKKSQRFHCTDYPPCNLSFTRSEHLARHIMKHTGERPFQCHCSRRFSSLDNLRQHAQTVHINENIPMDSLAVTGSRFQRQIRTDRVRQAGDRARALTSGSAGGPIRRHSKSLSTSSIQSINSVGSTNSTQTNARRRLAPLVMASSATSTTSASVVKSSELKQPTRANATIEELKVAISKLDHDRVHSLLKNSFEDVAVGEYSWLTELRLLEYSTDEIADELLEKSRDGPWIFSEFEIPNVEAFAHGIHIQGCVHSGKGKSEKLKSAAQSQSVSGDSVFLDKTGAEFSVRESVEYFCGIGGVSPVASGAHDLQFGSVVFENNNSTAIVSLADSESGEVLSSVLQRLEKAAAILQQVGGCCDSFTFLARHGSLVELERVDLRIVQGLAERLSSAESSKPTPQIQQLFAPLFPRTQLGVRSWTDRPLDQPSSDALAAQFLSLAFLSYSQGQCGPVRPFFLDTPPQHILLIGNNVWSPDFEGPCILGSLVELSCFGDMLQQPVFAFQYFDGFERFNTAIVFSEDRPRLDLKASPEDLLDTWGPGEFIAPNGDTENLYAISIGGGLIAPTSAVNKVGLPILHWSRAVRFDTLPTSTFPRSKKVIVGARVSANDKCDAEPHKQLRMAASLLEELGTFPSYWEVCERQLGLGIQAGQSAVALLRFNQTWVKRHGLTKKSKLLAQKSLYMADLEGPSGVQVSVCTGIAQRIRLRDLLADVLPVYVGALVTKPRHWKTLVEDFDLLTTLREGDLGTWLGNLDHELQKTFESLAVAVLFLLQDTGVDRKGQNFIIGCIQPDLPFQCFNIPCRRENYWARMVADSEDVATFAYMTAQCLETNAVKCRGSGASWANSTALFWTAVSCCQQGRAEGNATPPQAQWTLKHSEAYLIGRVDAPLLVQVDRPNEQEEPRLLVSMSTIRLDILRRLYRKGRPGKPRRLRERRPFDQIAESVVVIANHGG